MRELAALNQFFWKYRVRFFSGILLVIATNYLAVLAPQITGYVVGLVQAKLPGGKPVTAVQNDLLIHAISKISDANHFSFGWIITFCSITILVLAILRGVFMFFMRQTMIVMSRHIEYDQKNQVYKHYQALDTEFYKTHSTGDLMSRITEDVSRVRMYTGPSLMYLVNLISLIGFCLYNMFSKDIRLSLYVLSPLPILAITIYMVNSIINKKSEEIQGQLSDLTTNAQESYSGIRVIKSFVQEKAMLGFFKTNSELYRKNAVSLAKVEAFYTPTMALMIGLSTLLTIYLGGLQAIKDPSQIGTIVEFVIYINMLTFPVSAIGWTASMIQRAAASQKRLNEFLSIEPTIQNKDTQKIDHIKGDIQFDKVDFIYPHSGIKALNQFSLEIKAGEKVLILGKTGSGKSSIAQLLNRMYHVNEGVVKVDGKPIESIDFTSLRRRIGYVQQDVFLFSDSIKNNIQFGVDSTDEAIESAARSAHIFKEIQQLPAGFETLVGERGTTLSGGQKQRISIARALIKEPDLFIFDDCLSAVDANTEKTILTNLSRLMQDKTALFITHRIFFNFHFDKIIYIQDGHIAESGTHESLLAKQGLYAELYQTQLSQNQQ
ncbi:MAG: ABC transporter ATP-binding protein [Sediminibacterium sp.]|nr:ABC transporter ATP-binding protein [Sediminibacterium sp.]MBP6144087.1 ABC transporter ATP-binding protein [Sediminibacterium sp.]